MYADKDNEGRVSLMEMTSGEREILLLALTNRINDLSCEVKKCERAITSAKMLSALNIEVLTLRKMIWILKRTRE